MKWNLDKGLFGGLALLAILLLGNATIGFLNLQQLRNDVATETHTQRVAAAATTLLSLASDAEAGQRGFLISGEDTYLGPYFSARNALSAIVDTLRVLTLDDPEQQARITELQRVLAKRLKLLEDGIVTYRTLGFDAVRRQILTNGGKVTMDTLRTQTALILSAESAVLSARRVRATRSYQIALLADVVMLLLGVLLLVVFLRQLQSNLRSRDHTAAALAEQRELLRVTLQSIGDAVITTDTAGRVTFLNGVAESLTGWKQERAFKQPIERIFVIVNESTRQAVENPIVRALRDRKIVGLANHTLLIRPDGTETHIDDSAAPICRDDGTVVGAVLVFRDIGARRAHEEQLRQHAAHLSETDRRKTEFLAVLSHELRNPLAPIVNTVQLLQIREATSESIRQGAQVIGRQVAILTRLIDDLLDMSRITTGRIELRLQSVDFVALARQAVEVTGPQLVRRSQSFRLEVPDAKILVHADSVRLIQCIGNLLQNASKYTAIGGSIALRVSRSPSHAVLSVTDNGIGLAAKDLARVFELFAQVDHPLDRDASGGLGIGLALVRRLMLLHDGTVEAQSDGLGCGSAFILRLPVMVGLARVLPIVVPTVENIRTRSILVVDDNQDSALSLATLLQTLGHELMTASDGLEALAIVEQHRPDVVLLDIGLPKLNGYEVAARIRDQSWGADIRLIALTGWGQGEDRERSRAAGFDDHLVKPATLQNIMAAIERLSRNADIAIET